MKLGMKREKIGDILLDKEGADILLCPDMVKFVQMHLTQLTRFQKAKVESISLEQLKKIEISKEEITMTIPSMRIDAIIAELVHGSRSKANLLLEQERVFLNAILVTKPAKEVQEEDFITIRGKGKFQIKQITGKTRKGNLFVKVEKWI